MVALSLESIYEKSASSNNFINGNDIKWFKEGGSGTSGREGLLATMLTGEVDENWAKQHHDRWYEEVMEDSDDVPVSAAKSSSA